MADLRQVGLAGTIERAIELIDATFKALAVPDRWCPGAWAADGAGQPICGDVLEAVESERVAARSLFGELLHQGLRRRFRISLAPCSESEFELVQAPPSFLAAVATLTFAQSSVVLLDQLVLSVMEPWNELSEVAEPPRARRARRTLRLDPRRSYEDTVWTLVLAAEFLRGELEGEEDMT